MTMNAKRSDVTPGEQACDFVLDILEKVVTNPEPLRAEHVFDKDRKITQIKIFSDHDDVGLIIGREGQNIAALSRLLSMLGGKLKCKFSLGVDNPQNND